MASPEPRPAAATAAWREAARRQLPWLASIAAGDRGWLLTGLVLAVLMRHVLASPSPNGGDTPRFLAQAVDLAAGARYAFAGQPATALPPGYPLFLRVVLGLGGGLSLVLVVQFLLGVASCLLLWQTVARTSPSAAGPALWLLALNPWSAQRASYLMSETLGEFLVALLLWAAASARRGPRPWQLAPLGLLAAAVALNSPAAAILAALLAVEALVCRPSWRGLVALTLGALVVVVPWQAWCWSSQGRLEPTLLRPSVYPASGLGRWARTWQQHAWHVSVAWGPARIAPASAFENPAARAALLRADAQRPAAIADYRLGSPYDLALAEAAERQAAAAPLDVHLLKPLQRAAFLWLDHSELAGTPVLPAEALFQPAAASRAPGELVWTRLAWGLNAALAALLLAALARALLRRPPGQLALALGLLAYTAAAAWTGLIEFRRNLPLLPVTASLVAGFVVEAALPRAAVLARRARGLPA